jgi:electron transfer flavoprotein alpha/beta subunit
VDKNAIELALSIKESLGAEIVVLSMGPPQAEEALREALAMGVDKAYLLTDMKFKGADTLATSYTLSLAIKNILKYMDANEKYLVICGVQAIDGDTGQVGPELAEELNIPHVTNVQKIQVEPDKIIAESVFRTEEIIVLETRLPALITVLKKINEPRFPTISGIVDSHDKKEVVYMNSKSLNAVGSRIGLDGSQTQVWRIFVPELKGERMKLSGTTEEMVKDLCQKLRDEKLL